MKTGTHTQVPVPMTIMTIIPMTIPFLYDFFVVILKSLAKVQTIFLNLLHFDKKNTKNVGS